MNKTKRLLVSLFLFSLLIAAFFIGWGSGLSNFFVFGLRIKKVIIFILVSLSSSFATVAFQAVVNNRFLTPSILGIESYYRFLQTLLIFFGGSLLTATLSPAWQFLLVTGLMVGSYLLFSRFSWQNISFDLHTVLLIGLVISMLFNSVTTFLQVLMDPNEYDQLQMRLFPTFQNVSNQVLLIAIILSVPILWSLWRKTKIIEVLAMGPEQAINLGLDTNKEVKKVFLQVIVLSAIPATLVGPMIFLGFTTANVAYLLFQTYRMNLLFLSSSVIGFLALLIGQFIVEHVFHLQTNTSIVIEWLGGILFFVLLWRERKKL